MLYRYGLRLGLELCLRGRFKNAVRFLAIPVNYWRNLEFKLVYDEAEFRRGERVLDISSPKLMSLYLAEKVGAQVRSTDIEDYFINQYEVIRKMRGVSSDNLCLGTEDGRKLSFDDESFDKVYSISVVEHIPDEGDTSCLKEIRRVLSYGGRCVLTVPFWPTSRVDYRGGDFYWAGSSVDGENGKVFFQRRYSEEDIYDRLINPSGLTLKKLAYFGERLDVGSDREISDYLPRISGPLQPMLSNLLHVKPTNRWQDLKKPLGALIVLEKEAQPA